MYIFLLKGFAGLIHASVCLCLPEKIGCWTATGTDSFLSVYITQNVRRKCDLQPQLFSVYVPPSPGSSGF